MILIACVTVTENQLRFWRDTETLFTHALKVTQKNGLAHMMLGVARERDGLNDEALQEYQKALGCEPSLMVQVAGGEKRSLAAQVQLLLGQSAEQQGNPDAALAAYEQALKSDSDLVEAHNNMGNLLANLGKPDEALAHYQSAVNLRPDMPLTHENLGTQLVELGRVDDAMKEYQAAARLAPLDPRPFYLMGKAWLRCAQGKNAVAAFQEALRLVPDDLQSLIFLARILASDPDPGIRNGAQAIILAERADKLTDGRQPFVLATLAMAYAEAGRFDEARKAVQTALDLMAAGGHENISTFRSQLRFYESNQPYRDVFTNLPRQGIP